MISWDDTIPFVAPITGGQVIKVYDGDTITIASKLPYETSPVYRFSVRLNGIDCPEIKGENDDEKQCAQLAKKELEGLILNKKIFNKKILSSLMIVTSMLSCFNLTQAEEQGRGTGRANR